MIKKLAGCVREYKKSSILSPLYVSIEVILECFIPFITAQMINIFEDKNKNGVTGDDFNKLLLYGGALVLCAFLSLTCGVLAGNHCATAGCGFAKNLRKDLF